MLLDGKRRKTMALVTVLMMCLNSHADCSECIREDTPKTEDDTQDCKFSDNDTLGAEIPVINKTRAVISSSTGELEVTFLFSNRIESYWIKLWINEDANTSEACSVLEAKWKDDDTIHSTHDFPTVKCQDMMGFNTTEFWVGSVTFKNVYTGCYWITIDDGRNESNALSPTFYVTEYSKKLIQPIEPEISFQFFPATNGRKNIQLVMRYEVLNKEKLPVSFSLQKWLNEKSCAYKEYGEKLAFWELSMKEDNSLMCKRKDQTEYSYHCEWDDDKVTCVLENYQDGPYCVTITPVDPVRCTQWTVWASDPCTRRVLFNVTGVIPLQDVKLEGNNDEFIIGPTCGLAAVCCLFVIVIIVTANSRKKHEIHPLQKPVPQFNPVVQPQILLLYAQDCNEFMTLMASFRELLKNVGKCEVLDCFDPDRAEEIAKSPVEWMCHWVSSPQVKVVVVANNCAIAQQEAMIRGINLQYKEPTPNSHLFLYGLKEITYNHKRGDYNCTFVVRYSAMDLSYLTPYTRYELPPHLPYLLRNLNPNVNLTELDGCVELKEFIANHTELMKFEKQNPLYLNYLMFKSHEGV